MRVDLSRLREDRGAVIPIIALSLIALFGMVVLGVDVGGLMAKRRHMVNATDSGALAAAHAYASTEADCGITDAIAQGRGIQYAQLNVAGAAYSTVGTAYDPNCPERTVRVGFEDEQDLFFAPILGFGPNSMVRAVATAEWGHAGGGNAVPIVLNIGTFQGNCPIPQDDQSSLPIGTPCYLWYDNDRFDGSVFGFMNLDHWGVAPSASCPNAGASQRWAWIQGGYPDALVLNYIDGPTNLPTYVCSDSGLASSDWTVLAGEVGEYKLFPINHQPTQIMGSGGTQIDKYNIIGFATLQIDGVLTVQQAGGGSGSCTRQHNFTSQPVLDLDTLSCLSGTDPAATTITNLVLRKGGTTYVEGSDYTYDPSTHVVSWNLGSVPNPGSVQVRFDWTEDGICGPPPNNASARCLLTSWQGHRVGGMAPGSGADFGTQAIRLIE